MKKKIMFMLPALLGGGAEKVLVDILKNFDYDSYEITLLLEYKDGVYLSDVPKEVRILTLHQQDSIWLERLHRVLRFFHLYISFHEIVYRLLLIKLLKHRRFDTIVSFMEGSMVKFHSYITHKADNNISWVHIDFERKHWSLVFFKNEKEERKAYDKMDKIVFVSEKVKNGFCRQYSIENNKCVIIYNLIDRNVVQRLAESNNVAKKKFTICMVGRLNRQKRYDRAIEVAYRLKKEGYDFELWIIGDGGLKHALQLLVNKYELNDYVYFLGFQKPSYHYMKKADIYLNTSEAEGFPLVICEALCLGLPIVATNISGSSEILSDSRNGILTSETIEDIFNSVKMLMKDSCLRKEYSTNALLRSKVFDVNATMSHIYEIL